MMSIRDEQLVGVRKNGEFGHDQKLRLGISWGMILWIVPG